MPELPEVETIVRGLRGKLSQQEFSHIDVRLAKSVRSPKKLFIASLQRRKIMGMERRGKYIIFRLSDGKALLIHLRMTGRLILVPAALPKERHTHVIFSFKDYPSQLRFVDQRQFGRLTVEKPTADGKLESLAGLGPEPLELSPGDFIRAAQARHRAIKPLLLDQGFLAGVGNIYADEALYRPNPSPTPGGCAERKGPPQIISVLDTDLAEGHPGWRYFCPHLRKCRRILRQVSRLPSGLWTREGGLPGLSRPHSP